MPDDTSKENEQTDADNVSVFSDEEEGSDAQQSEHREQPVVHRRERTVHPVHKDSGAGSKRNEEKHKSKDKDHPHHTPVETQQETTDPAKVKKPLSEARKASLKKANETRMSMLARAREIEKQDQSKHTSKEADLKEMHETLQKLMKRSDKEKIRRRIEEKERFKRKRWVGKQRKNYDSETSDDSDEEESTTKHHVKKQVRIEEPVHKAEAPKPVHRAHQMPQQDATYVRRTKLADMIFG